MSTATIVPKYVNPPKEGKKYGSIKDAEDNRYAVPAALIGQIQKGQTLTFQWKQATWGGEPVKIVESIVSGASSAGEYKPPPDNPEKVRQIFIQGIAQAVLTGMHIPSNLDAPQVRSLVFSAVEAARDAYEAVLMARKPDPIAPNARERSEAHDAMRAEMDDEIPYDRWQ